MDIKLGDTAMILDACRKYGLLRNQAAYVLATAYHESGHTMKPVEEYGGSSYLKSKDYYPYYGRGYVQVTWEKNYRNASKLLGVDFISFPKLLLEPKFAVPCLVVGMKDGWFTGKKLSDYITLQRSDFGSARKIINGMDKAALIADYARAYDSALKGAGYGAVVITPSVTPIPAHPVIIPIEEPQPSLLSRLRSLLGW